MTISEKYWDYFFYNGGICGKVTLSHDKAYDKKGETYVGYCVGGAGGSLHFPVLDNAV